MVNVSDALDAFKLTSSPNPPPSTHEEANVILFLTMPIDAVELG
jgi:hypothetical protein